MPVNQESWLTCEAFRIDVSHSRLSDVERAKILENPGFGRFFTDHMSLIDWEVSRGWHGARVTGLRPFTLHPGCVALHYAQGVFEGLKAYGRSDGSVWLFRPLLNARRFRQSAARMALPLLNDELFMSSLVSLVRADRAWVPVDDRDCSLYLRPFMFGAEISLTVRPSQRVTYAVIASPAAPYFPNGINGMRLWVGGHPRAWEGGTGNTKFGGNYASNLLRERESETHGCDLVLYTDTEGYLQESGTMNIFAITADGELHTPRLGTILEGVTRASVLSIATAHGLTPVERRISIDEFAESCVSGVFREVFAVGTAAVVNPIVGVKGPHYEFAVSDGSPGPQSLALRDHLLDIQYGRRPDPFKWMVEIPLG
ncbi:branched-chain amino acid aminotransferase [Mycolicibacterium sp. XJ1904]